MPAEDPRRYIRIHADLSARIKDGRLPSGTLLSIGLIADEWSVARETVQRSIRMLEADGLVTRYPGIGWQVNSKETPPDAGSCYRIGGCSFSQPSGSETDGDAGDRRNRQRHGWEIHGLVRREPAREALVCNLNIE